jgi:hypothetical protein
MGILLINVKIKIQPERMYAQSQNIWKPNNVKSLEATKTKGLHVIAKLKWGYIYMSERDWP